MLEEIFRRSNQPCKGSTLFWKMMGCALRAMDWWWPCKVSSKKRWRPPECLEARGRRHLSWREPCMAGYSWSLVCHAWWRLKEREFQIYRRPFPVSYNKKWKKRGPSLKTLLWCEWNVLETWEIIGWFWSGSWRRLMPPYLNTRF